MTTMLSIEEFTTELIVELEERIEGGFTLVEEQAVREVLEDAIVRLEEGDSR